MHIGDNADDAGLFASHHDHVIDGVSLGEEEACRLFVQEDYRLHFLFRCVRVSVSRFSGGTNQAIDEVSECDFTLDLSIKLSK